MSKSSRSPFSDEGMTWHILGVTDNERRKATAYIRRHTSGADLAQILRMLGLEDDDATQRR